MKKYAYEVEMTGGFDEYLKNELHNDYEVSARPLDLTGENGYPVVRLVGESYNLEAAVLNFLGQDVTTRDFESVR